MSRKALAATVLALSVSVYAFAGNTAEQDTTLSDVSSFVTVSCGAECAPYSPPSSASLEPVTGFAIGALLVAAGLSRRRAA